MHVTTREFQNCPGLNGIKGFLIVLEELDRNTVRDDLIKQLENMTYKQNWLKSF